MVMVDVKEWPAVEPTARAIAEAGAADRVTIGCFSQARTVATGHAIARLTGLEVPLGLGVAGLLVRSLRLPRIHNGERWIAQIPSTALNSGVVHTLASQRIPIYLWTVNEAEELRKAVLLPIDGVITDNPFLARQIFAKSIRRTDDERETDGSSE